MTTKTFGVLDAVVKAAGDSGEFEAILSVPSVDRDGEIIDPFAFNPLPAKITIDIDHGMSVASTVGSAEPYYTPDGVLMCRGTFASTSRAQEVRTLVKEGHIDRMSVAYRAARYEIDQTDGLPHLRSGELLNAAIVPIPANRDAAILVAKTGARNSAKDLERIQSIFELAADLGAVCPNCAGKAAAAPDTKTADTDPEPAAAPAAAAPAEVTVDPAALAVLAEAELVLLTS